MQTMSTVKKSIITAVCIALCYVLPLLFHGIQGAGQIFCPMHIPALLCGFVCGWGWGLAVGFIAPLLRSVLFGMPDMFPTAVSMAFELAVYGVAAGALYRALPRKTVSVYLSLIIAMIAGRLVWGVMRYLLAGLAHSAFTPALSSPQSRPPSPASSCISSSSPLWSLRWTKRGSFPTDGGHFHEFR